MNDHVLLLATAAGAAAAVVMGFVLLALVLKGRPPDAVSLKAALADELRAERQEAATAARDQRAELQSGLKALTDSVVAGIGETRVASEHLREALSGSVRELQAGNERKLDEMRLVVDEKLQGTLEKRLGESFALVSEQLEAVHRGLGEMRALASGVGDLKKVLTNVKTRGTFGEMQLHAILEQILSPEQYRENFAPNEESGHRVEFAIALPGREGGHPVYLPVDSKFPQEDFIRLVDAADRGDTEEMTQARSDLVGQVKAYAKSVSEKYVNPPVTTDFAVLFLPTEGLYAEVLRQPCLVEDLQRSYCVAIAGPTTFAAFLNSLRIGFRTLAIEQRSSQLWQILGAVKTEFGKFGEVIAKLRKQLGSATATLDATTRRTRAMERKLREVEELPPDLAAGLIGLPPGDEGEGLNEVAQIEEQTDAALQE